jgi:hypothetical protein
MRINQSMLLKVANDAVAKHVGTDRTLLAVYLQGSLLGDSPLLGNSADIDLFLIHTNEVGIEREIVRISLYISPTARAACASMAGTGCIRMQDYA